MAKYIRIVNFFRNKFFSTLPGIEAGVKKSTEDGTSKEFSLF